MHSNEFTVLRYYKDIEVKINYIPQEEYSKHLSLSIIPFLLLKADQKKKQKQIPTIFVTKHLLNQKHSFQNYGPDEELQKNKCFMAISEVNFYVLERPELIYQYF